jgi:hypothetical protein
MLLMIAAIILDRKIKLVLLNAIVFLILAFIFPLIGPANNFE